MSKIGTVLEIEKTRVLVMTGECDFVFIKRKPDMFIGQQITVENTESGISNIILKRIMPVAAGVAAVLIAVFLLFFRNSSPGIVPETYAIVDLDINPSMEFSIDIKDVIQKAVPLNKDAEAILKDTDYKGIALDNAISDIIDKSRELGFVESDGDTAVLASASLNDKYAGYKESKDTQEHRLNELLDSIKITLDDKASLYKIITVTPKTQKEAAKNGISMGRQAAIEKARSKGNELSVPEIKESTVPQIIEELDDQVIATSTPLVTDTKVNTAATALTKISPTSTKSVKPTAKPTPKSEKVVYNATAPEVSGKIANNKIVLNWTPVEGDSFEYYKVVISKTDYTPRYPDNGYLYAISDINTTTATIDNSSPYNSGDFGEYLTPGQKYFFSVTAVYSDRKEPGNTISLTYPGSTTAQLKPKVSATVGSNKITLKWSPISVEGFQYYKVVISKSNSAPRYPDDGYLYAIDNKNTTTAVIDNSSPYNGGDFGQYLTPGQKYYISVTLVYNDKKVPGNVLRLTYPGAATSTSSTTPKLTSSVEGNKIILKWTPAKNDGFVYYKVVISRNNPKPKYPDDGYLTYFTDINTLQTTVDCSQSYNGGDIDGNLIPGQKYYFSITYCYSNGNIPSNVLYLTCPGG